MANDNQAPFPVQPELTAIAIAYRNAAYTLIGDLVMPRVTPPLAVKAFKWFEHNLADGYSIPDTAVGRLGRPAEVSWSGVEKEGACKDYGLDEPVPQDDIDQSRGTPFNPLGGAVERTTNLVILDRERRVAGITFDAANYEAANVQTLVGTDQFSDYVNSDPVGVLSEMLDGTIVRANYLTMGQTVWSKLKLHPKIIKAIYPTGNGAGIITRQQMAELLEVKEIRVGESRVNVSRKGQAANLARTWGSHIAGHFQDPSATHQGGVTWGLTLQYGTKVAGSRPDGNIGLRGGQRVRSGESVAELVLAKAAGFLLVNAVA
jgi:hypothetical protein